MCVYSGGDELLTDTRSNRAMEERGEIVKNEERFLGGQANTDLFLIESTRGWRFLNLKEIWQYRELLYFLVWRDLRVRYKQTVIGVAWGVLQPLLMMFIFTVVFGYLAKVPSGGVPYPIFVYSALLVWIYFSSALSQGGASLISNANLISKIYFPRLIIPLVSVITHLIDFALSFMILLCMMFWFGIQPTGRLLMVPGFLAIACATALGINLWFSALNVRYRDVGYLLPVIIQLWFYLSPIIYPISLVPEKWQLLYSLNPMVVVIQGFRFAFLGMQEPGLQAIMTSLLIVVALLVSGIVYFRSTEKTFADVI
jgi:homopolymeric O-antigen transport system permease protein